MRVIAFAALLVASPAAAQLAPGPVDISGLATRGEMAALCAPGTAMPQAEAVAGSAGSLPTCLRSDAKLPRITRAGIAATTDTNGAWSITWSTSLPAAPVTLPIPLNTGAQPIVCNVATSTMTGATGRCWLARTLPAALLTISALISFDPNGAPASGINVQVLAIPATQ